MYDVFGKGGISKKLHHLRFGTKPALHIGFSTRAILPCRRQSTGKCEFLCDTDDQSIILMLQVNTVTTTDQFPFINRIGLEIRTHRPQHAFRICGCIPTPIQAHFPEPSYNLGIGIHQNRREGIIELRHRLLDQLGFINVSLGIIDHKTIPFMHVQQFLQSNVTTCAEVGQAVTDGVTSPGIPDAIPLVDYFPEDRSGDRMRFTIAHEIGHLVLHRKRSPADRTMMEHEAHAFARELLMPADDARESVTSDFTLEDYSAVKAGRGISIAAAVRRAKDVGIIDERRYKSLYVQMSQRHWLKHEPFTVEEEHPILFKQMVGRAFDGLDDYRYPSVSRTGVEGFLGVSYELLNTWCDHHLTLRQDSMPEL